MWRGVIASAGRAILDFALPPRCPGCGDVQDESHLFCGACWGGLDWLGGGCARCVFDVYDEQLAEWRETCARIDALSAGESPPGPQRSGD